jgi:hypothetical protein
VVDGDILIAMFMAQRVAASTTLTPPAGWTVIDSSRVKDAAGSTCDSAIYWKRAAGESGSYTFTNTSASTQLVVMAYSGEVASGSPVAGSSKNFTTDPTSSGVTASAFAVTTTANNEDVIWLAHNWVNSAALAPPTGMTERFDGFLYAADLVFATAGSAGPYFQTTGNTAAQPWTAFLVAVKPSAGVGGVVGQGLPVVTVVGQAALAVTEVVAGKGGMPVTEALSRIGLPVTKVASGGLPVIYVTPP